MSIRVPQRTVPGPAGREIAMSVTAVLIDPLKEYVALTTRYGDAVRIPIGRHRYLYLLSRPEHAEHVLATHQDNYVKSFTYRPLRALLGNGLLTSEGEDWRRHRRLLQPLFSRREVTRFAPMMTDAAQRMLKSWDEMPDGAVLDVGRQMSALALDVVGRALFGADLTGDAARMSRAIDAGQRIAVLATLLPLSWGPRSSRAIRAVARRAGGTPTGMTGPVERLIASRRAELGAGGAGTNGSVEANGTADLLDVLLTARAEDGTTLTHDEVTAEATTFMLAGHETSANALGWSLALLSAFPAARERLEQEVESVLAGRAPEAGDAGKLTWTSAVVAEAMRLYPPAWTIERDAVTDDNVAGVPVRAGSMVAISPYLVHRNPDFWPDPAGFDPRRFLAPEPERPRYAYIPFGGGRRACIGQAFAELETVIVLASIAQRYRLELSARGIPAPQASVTLRPGRGLRMRLLRRR
ncbi:MAG TPA: cytochrome P450 [Streptosporangiaceae bacterium]